MNGIAMLGTGFIAGFYTQALHGKRSRDRVDVVYSRSAEKGAVFATRWGIPTVVTDMKAAIEHPDTKVVIVALPNHLHEEAVLLAANAGKAILCTKPLGRTAAEARRMLEAVEKAGVFHGYLEDLVYTPKTLNALHAVQRGSLGTIMWVRSRETHPGPHSDWFWDRQLAGGGAMIDMGCHCIEIARNFIGKEIRPVEVSCWADTQVHPIEAEDHAIGLVRYENGAIGQFEVSWSFRGGMDLRDEIVGTDGTIWLNHWLRTGTEMFTAVGTQDYVAEKAEGNGGWLFPVADEATALGYADMFTDMFDCLERGNEPMETFYDGYVVNAILDSAYYSTQSRKWEKIDLEHWRGKTGVPAISAHKDFDEDHFLIKQEKMPDGRTKVILKHKRTHQISAEWVPKAD
ncbi:MAG: Gfo/Idh/MocA family oxidoreductase [Zavarzinella sp.]